MDKEERIPMMPRARSGLPHHTVFRDAGQWIVDAALPAAPFGDRVADAARNITVSSGGLIAEDEAIRVGRCRPIDDTWERRREHLEERDLVLASQVVDNDEDHCRLFLSAQAERARLILHTAIPAVEVLVSAFGEAERKEMDLSADVIRLTVDALFAQRPLPMPSRDALLAAYRLRLATEIIVGQTLGLPTIGFYLDDSLDPVAGAVGHRGASLTEARSRAGTDLTPDRHREQLMQAFAPTRLAGRQAFESIIPGRPPASPAERPHEDDAAHAQRLVHTHGLLIDQLARAIPAGGIVTGDALDQVLDLVQYRLRE